MVIIIKTKYKFLLSILSVLLVAEVIILIFFIKNIHIQQQHLNAINKNQETLKVQLEQTLDEQQFPKKNVPQQNLKQIRAQVKEDQTNLATVKTFSNDLKKEKKQAQSKQAMNQKLYDEVSGKQKTQDLLGSWYQEDPLKNHQFQEDGTLKKIPSTTEIKELEATVTTLPNDSFKAKTLLVLRQIKQQRILVDTLQKEMKPFIQKKQIVKYPDKEKLASLNEMSRNIKEPETQQHYLQALVLLKKPKPKEENNKKMVALTFDDGPNASSTLDIVSILKKHKVTATFFMLGLMVDQNKEVVETIHKEGFTIANHSYSHKDLTKISAANRQSEINVTNEKIKAITGETPIYLRPPYGAFNKAVTDTTPMTISLWNVDSLDWKSKNPKAIEKEVRQQVKEKSVILMHDIYPTTAQSLDNVITYLKKEGYSFYSIEELLPYL